MSLFLETLKRAGIVLDAAYLADDAPRKSQGLRCSACGISDAVDGIFLDEQGVCNECRRYDAHKHQLAAYFGNQAQLRTLFERNAAARRSEYDCLLLYSGGKDSTYVLYQLLDMGLKVRTFTFDNGFISRQALANIEAITSEAGVVHTTATHAEMDAVFRESLRRHSTVCKGCFRSLLDLSLEFADQQGINVIVTGLSRGQIIEERLHHFYGKETFDAEMVEQRLREGRRIYHSIEPYPGLDASRFSDFEIFDRVALVDFFRYSDVSKEAIYAFLKTRSVRWSEPTDTGFCSSNCMINDVGVLVHGQEKGYSNYEVPTAWEVRVGHLKRDAALAELAPVQNKARLIRILNHIDYAPRTKEVSSDRPGVIYCVPKQGAGLHEVTRFLRSAVPGVALPRIVAVKRIPRSADGAVEVQRLLEIRAETVEVSGNGEPLKANGTRDLDEAPSPDGWMIRSVTSPAVLDKAVFGRALLQIVLHHRHLRARARQVDGQWTLHHPAPSGGLPLLWMDLSERVLAERGDLAETMSRRVLDKLRASEPEALLKCVVLANDANGGSTLIVCAHALAIDAFSLHVFLGDLAAAYAALAAGKAVALPSVSGDAQEPPVRAGRFRVAPRPRRSRSMMFAADEGAAAFGDTTRIDAVLAAVRSALAAEHVAGAVMWLRWRPGRGSVGGQPSWRHVGPFSTCDPEGDSNPSQSADGDSGSGEPWSFVGVALPREAPLGRSSLFAAGDDLGSPELSQGPSWVVARECEVGLCLTWSAEPLSAADAALGRAVENAVQSFGKTLEARSAVAGLQMTRH